jgi:hypothetical protein
MKKLLLLIVLIPVFTIAQSKRKKAKAKQQENETIVANLKTHIQYLADDKLEGRRTGTRGELLAMQYISKQYEQMGIEPKGAAGYIQEFEIDEGKLVDESKTFLSINDTKAVLNADFFPLAFSASKAAKGNPAVALNESGLPWFRDVKDALDENQSNPHFDVFDYIKKEADKVADKGASALLLYNSSSLIDNIQYNKKDKSAATRIPVIFITKDGFKKFFPDVSASVNIELNVSFSQSLRKVRNVIGYINNNASNTVILGAHYDHLGYGEDKNALDTAHVVHNGADDNASGTAALIELTRLLKKSSPKNNNYLIINFSGEELGLFGSKYWLEHPTTNITANYMINMDMIGRYDTARKLTIGGYGTSPVWGEIFQTTTDKNLIVKFDSSGAGPSDHEAFYRKDMPVLFFFTGSHPDYHKSTDDWDKINYDAESEIVQYVYQLIEATDTKGKLAFTKTREQEMGKSSKFSVSLGIMPDYGYTGTGVRADGIVQGKLAERIGLQAGDILLQLGDYKFVDVMSYMKTLGKFKKGDKTKLTIQRKEEKKEFNIEF